MNFEFQCMQWRYDWCKYQTVALKLYFEIKNNNTLVVKLEFTNKIGIKYDWLLHTRLDAVLNILGLGYFRENRIKVDYLIHILQWSGIHLKKKEIKQVYFKPIL